MHPFSLGNKGPTPLIWLSCYIIGSVIAIKLPLPPIHVSVLTQHTSRYVYIYAAMLVPAKELSQMNCIG
jgi:hypothetical protein